MYKTLYRIQAALARSGLVAYLAAKVRNQLNQIIGLHLGPTPDGRANGEFLLADRLAPRCRLFVDVGANLGEWTARFLQSSPGGGHLFEPSARACAALRERFPADRVTIHNAALGDQEGMAAFHEVGECGETSFVGDAAGGNGQPVRITTLDREFGGTEAGIDFLKIDAEGYDLKILHGARDLLARGRVRYLQFEYNSFWLRSGSSLRAALDYLDGLGYVVRLVTRRGLAPVRYDLWGDFFFYSNFFACHRDDLRGVEDLMC